jgi:rhodanese-related sulfurtransferase
MKHLRKLLDVFLILGLAACAVPGDPARGDSSQPAVGIAVPVSSVGEYIDIQPRELKALIDSEDILLVNVKVPYMGHIEGTDLFIPYDRIGQESSHLDETQADRIVLYCRSGRSSAIAAETLVRLGYENIYNLSGGFQAWQAAGYPLLQRE